MDMDMVVPATASKPKANPIPIMVNVGDEKHEEKMTTINVGDNE